MAKVKCANCGFLALRNQATRQLAEAEDSFRSTGQIPAAGSQHGIIIGVYEKAPLCFALAANLREEFAAAHGAGAFKRKKPTGRPRITASQKRRRKKTA